MSGEKAKGTRESIAVTRPEPGESDAAFKKRFTAALGDAVVKSMNETRERKGLPPLKE